MPLRGFIGVVDEIVNSRLVSGMKCSPGSRRQGETLNWLIKLVPKDINILSKKISIKVIQNRSRIGNTVLTKQLKTKYQYASFR